MRDAHISSFFAAAAAILVERMAIARVCYIQHASALQVCRSLNPTKFMLKTTIRS
jgi:hypothetical protein